MTLPSGTISLSQVNTELTLSATALISLNDAAVRSLAGVASGAISMSDLQGKTYAFTFSITANQTDANLRTLAVAAGWDQTKPVIATINSSIVISGSVLANSTPALTINGSWPNGVTLVNNGTIAGRGGTGTNGANSAAGGAAGGRAILASVAVSINNASGIIAGGGGGGAGGTQYQTGSMNWTNPSTSNSGTDTMRAGSGGGSGGQGGNVASSGGTGGPVFWGGPSGAVSQTGASTGGTGGLSGPGGIAGPASVVSEASWYTSGTYSVTGVSGGSGGTWGVAAGTAAGECVSGISFVTFTAVGTRYGALV